MEYDVEFVYLKPVPELKQENLFYAILPNLGCHQDSKTTIFVQQFSGYQFI